MYLVYLCNFCIFVILFQCFLIQNHMVTKNTRDVNFIKQLQDLALQRNE